MTSLRFSFRFGIKFGTQPTDVERPLQEGDLPLSEGFHWESFPDSLLVPSSAVPCSQVNRLETQSESQTRDSSEQLDVPQASYSSKTAKMVSVKVEPKLEDENEEVSRKRTISMVEVSWDLNCGIQFDDFLYCWKFIIGYFCRKMAFLTDQTVKRRKQNQERII